MYSSNTLFLGIYAGIGGIESIIDFARELVRNFP